MRRGRRSLGNQVTRGATNQEIMRNEEKVVWKADLKTISTESLSLIITPHSKLLRMFS